MDEAGQAIEVVRMVVSDQYSTQVLGIDARLYEFFMWRGSAIDQPDTLFPEQGQARVISVEWCEGCCDDACRDGCCVCCKPGLRFDGMGFVVFCFVGD